MLDGFARSRRLRGKMTTHCDILRNDYFWFTD
jgi:hypothetical protein